MQGARNTRLKNFYAIWPLVHYHEFDRDRLARASRRPLCAGRRTFRETPAEPIHRQALVQKLLGRKRPDPTLGRQGESLRRVASNRAPASPIVEELRERIQRLESGPARRRTTLPFGVTIGGIAALPPFAFAVKHRAESKSNREIVASFTDRPLADQRINHSE